MSKLGEFFITQIVAISLLLFTVPSAFGQISNIQVSNLTSSSATITWTTTDTTDGCVHYGLTTSLGDTACDPRPDDDIHFVQISGLAADTTYYFEVESGGEVDNNGGSYYTFRTTKVGVGIPYTIYGLVYLPDSTTAAEGTIVSAVVKSLGGNSSYPLAALTDTMGLWFFNLGNLKDPTTNDVFFYSVGDTIFIVAQGAADGEGYDTVTVSGNSPQYCDTLTLSIPTITVISPNGGETWRGGDYYYIRWSAVNFIGNVKIDYSRNGGASFDSVIVSSYPNTGEYLWSVPCITSNFCRVRVCDAADCFPADTSDNDFIITECVPALSHYGIIVLLILLTGTAVWMINRRRLTT